MKIEQVRAVLLSYDCPPEDELLWVGGRIDTWDAALVEVVTADGITGLGEVAQGIMAAAAVPGVVDSLTPYLIGPEFVDPADVSAHLRARTAFWSRGGVSAGVLGAVEAACWDAAGKAAGVPAHRLMAPDAPPPDALGCYASGGLGRTTEQVLAWVRGQHEAGHTRVKFRAMADADQTEDLVRAVAAAAPAGLGLVLDLVQGCASRPWSRPDVLRVADVAAEHGLLWLEEPCHADDVDGYAAVRAAARLPVSGVESYSTVREFDQLIGAGGVDIAQPDASMLGGPSRFLEVAGRARAADVDIVPHIWGSTVTLMTNLHTAIAAGLPLVEWCTLTNPLRDATAVEDLFEPGGLVRPPTAPGLGVRLPDDPGRFAFRPGRGHVIA